MNVVDKAARIAAIAHRSQVRKQGDVPYIMHPVAVALLLAQHGFSDEVVAAALVHDVLEDTDFPESELRTQLGDEVLRIVHATSNDDSLPWEEKKMKYVETVRAGGEAVWAVAIADKIHNAKDLLASYEKEGSAVWTHFKRGKDKKMWFEERVLSMFKEEGWRHPLVAEYETLVQHMHAAE